MAITTRNLARRKARFAAATVAVGALLTFALLLAPPHGVPGKVELKLAGFSQTSNGVLLVSVILTNGTARALNVVDDADGNPGFVLDAGGATRDSPGRWLRPLLNQLKSNLAPGTSLTNVVWVTNPPPRFRLRVIVRDLAAESRGLPPRFLGPAFAEKVASWRRKREDPEITAPASVWIDPQMYRP